MRWVTERKSEPAEEGLGGRRVGLGTLWVWCVHGDGSELDVGRRLLPCSWVIAASVLFFPLLPSSGLRSRQKCMSQRYMVPARGQALEVWWGREAFGVQYLGCRLPGIPACLGGHWQGPGHRSHLAPPLFPIPSPSFVHSLDLSELAKAAKKKLQAVSLLGPLRLGAALHL